MPIKKSSSSAKSVIQKKHEGKWIALSMDFKKVLGYSDDVMGLVKKFGRDEVTYTKVLRSDVVYAFIQK